MGHEDETFEEFTARYDRCGMGRRMKAAERKLIGPLFWGKSWRKDVAGAQLTD